MIITLIGGIFKVTMEEEYLSLHILAPETRTKCLFAKITFEKLTGQKQRSTQNAPPCMGLGAIPHRCKRMNKF